MKRGVVLALTGRLSYISSELEEEKEWELNHLTDVLIENGYPRVCVKKWSKLSAGLCGRKCETMKEKGFVCLLCFFQL